VRVMPFCLCSVQGSHVLCWAVPQPRPELRFAGPYVLQAPLVQMPHVSSVLLTHGNRVQASPQVEMGLPPKQRMSNSQPCSGVKYMSLEGANSLQNTQISAMLKTLAKDLETCANVLLDAKMWNEEQPRIRFNVQMQEIQFWIQRGDSQSARFSTSLRALIEHMIKLLIEQRHQELDTETEGKNVWADLIGTLDKCQFFDLQNKKRWKVLIRDNGFDPEVIKRLAEFTKKMTDFFKFFKQILNDLKENNETWSECTSKICSEYYYAMKHSNVLDDLRKIEYMGPEELRVYIDHKQKALGISSKVREETKDSGTQLLRKYAHDLLIAPFSRELYTLSNTNFVEFKRCVRAMEDQNDIPQANRATFDNFKFSKDSRRRWESYAECLKPWPIIQDLECMTARQLEATVAQMHRDLFVPLSKRIDLDAMRRDENIPYAEKLLATYKRIEDPFRETGNSSSSVAFSSYTASSAAALRCRDIDGVAIELQTTTDRDETLQTLKLSICKFNEPTSDAQDQVGLRFSLVTSAVKPKRSRRNVTQFMEVTLDWGDDERRPCCLLTVYDTVDKAQGDSNSNKKTHYYIPWKHNEDSKNDQKEKLNVFLQQCATKIGKPICFDNSTDISKQLYRACDPILREKRKQRIARKCLLELLEGKEDVVGEIMAKTNNTD